MVNIVYDDSYMSSSRPQKRKGNSSQPTKADAPTPKRSRLLAMRADNTQSKVAVRLRDGFITPQKQAGLAARLDARFAEELSGYRPHTVDDDDLQLGSPLTVKTPGGSRYTLKQKMGPLAFYGEEDADQSNENDNPQTTTSPAELTFSDEFIESAAYQAIKEIRDDAKHRIFSVTQESLSQTQRAFADAGYKRHISQNRVMASSSSSSQDASATRYATAGELYNGTVRWEWLHLVAHAIEGPESQTDSNLVAGTMHANTNMMFVEGTMNYLSRMYPEGFTLNIRADLMPGSHIATKITYTIETKDFSLAFDFDAQTTTKPHTNVGEALRIFIPEYIESKRSKLSATSSSATLFAADRNAVAVAEPEEPQLGVKRS